MYYSLDYAAGIAMSAPYSIHTPEFWHAEFAAANEQIALHVGLEAQDVTPEVNLELHQITIQGVARALTLIKELALEHPAPAHVRPPKPRGRRPQRMIVRADPERHRVYFLRQRMSIEQARELGNMLLNAADVAANVIEGGAE